MLRTIHLHGSLKKQFGAIHRLDVATAGEALRALNCNYPGEFVRALQGGCFRVVRGDHRTGMPLSIDLVNDLKLGAADLHIIPVAAGAANGKGTTKVILGSALIGGAIFLSGGTLAAPLSMMSQPAIAGVGITWGNIAAVGLAVTLGGASTLLAKAESANNTPKDDSFSRVGPKQTASQGSAIPLIYGEVITSPVPVSIDADIEDIGAYQAAEGTLPGGDGTLFGGGGNV